MQKASRKSGVQSTKNNRTHVLRIMNDIQELYKESPTGLFIVADEENICLVHALIIGPEGTPYEGGFFYFVMKFPETYPLEPPKVELKTTYRGTVRFNPNLYACGRVCLSILGTWTGPSWSSVQTIGSTLLSIQSLMDVHPYYNEPGYERRKDDVSSEKDSNDYNAYVAYETMRVAVIEMLQDNGVDSKGMPTALKEVMISHFKSNFQNYENLIQSKLNLDGIRVRDLSNGSAHPPATFKYQELLKKIVALREKFSNIEDNFIPIYNEITTKTRSNGNRDDGICETNSNEDFEDFVAEEDVDGSLLYESESDNDSGQHE